MFLHVMIINTLGQFFNLKKKKVLIFRTEKMQKPEWLTSNW